MSITTIAFGNHELFDVPRGSSINYHVSDFNCRFIVYVPYEKESSYYIVHEQVSDNLYQNCKKTDAGQDTAVSLQCSSRKVEP